jgi:hypothetical protein
VGNERLGGSAALGGRMGVDGELPASERPRARLAREARQGGHAHPPANGRARRLRLLPRIRPVAHEDGTAGLEEPARLLLGGREHARRRHATLQQTPQVGQGLTSLGCVQPQPALCVQRLSAVAPERLKDVAVEALVLPPLPHVALERGLSGQGLQGQALQLRIGAGRVRHQVRAVVEHPHVHVPGHGPGAPLPHRRGHGAGEELGGEALGRKGRGQVRHPAGSSELGHPYDIHHQHVEVRRAPLQRGEEELVGQVRAVGQQLRHQLQLRVLALEVGEQGVEGGRVPRERLVPEDEAHPARGGLRLSRPAGHPEHQREHGGEQAAHAPQGWARAPRPSTGPRGRVPPRARQRPYLSSMSRSSSQAF